MSAETRERWQAWEGSPVSRIDRKNYASMFGPTTGDAIRLADTELWAQIEHDYTVYGDECKFGGGKVIRDGMGQSSGATRAQGVSGYLDNQCCYY